MLHSKEGLSLFSPCLPGRPCPVTCLAEMQTQCTAACCKPAAVLLPGLFAEVSFRFQTRLSVPRSGARGVTDRPSSAALCARHAAALRAWRDRPPAYDAVESSPLATSGVSQWS